MGTDADKALLHACLERAAETLGDITPHVMARYYAAFPQARDLFEALQPGGRANLEGQMVEQVLYCLMEWFDSPGEIEVVLVSTIPHHLDTLGVGAEQFFALVGTVFDALAETIPPDRADEAVVLAGLRQAIGDLVGQELEHALEWNRCMEARRSG